MDKEPLRIFVGYDSCASTSAFRGLPLESGRYATRRFRLVIGGRLIRECFAMLGFIAETGLSARASKLT